MRSLSKTHQGWGTRLSASKLIMFHIDVAHLTPEVETK